MKREIKFRAWDGKKIWYGGEIYSKSKDGNRSYPCEITSRGIEFISPCDSKHSDIIIDEQGRKGYQAWDIEKTNRDCEVMQFTGLKDKNGVDIYERDILKVPDDYEVYGFMAGEIREVYFKHGCFRLKPKEERLGRGHTLDDCIRELEIIGNIHEHKHLKQ